MSDSARLTPSLMPMTLYFALASVHATIFRSTSLVAVPVISSPSRQSPTLALVELFLIESKMLLPVDHRTAPQARHSATTMPMMISAILPPRPRRGGGGGAPNGAPGGDPYWGWSPYCGAPPYCGC